MNYMNDIEKTYPCPSCGFLIFNEPEGSFEICEICGWEDDIVQKQDPNFKGGANKISLIESQEKILKTIPKHIEIHKGFRRATNWEPLVTT